MTMDFEEQDSTPQSEPAAPVSDVDIEFARTWFQAQVAKGVQAPFTAERVTITPALARVMLEGNHAEERGEFNRTINPRQLERIKAAIRGGEWHYNGENIKVSTSGPLNDGQHRLFAICETGVSIITDIKFGLARESRNTVDMNVVRNNATFLQMSGITDPNNKATAIQWILRYENGTVVSKGLHSSAQSMAAMARYPEINDLMSVGRPLAKALGISIGLALAASVLLNRSNPEAFKSFATMLIERRGWSDVKGDPVFALSDRMTRNALERRKVTQYEQFAFIVKAWNAWRTGRTLNEIRFRPGVGKGMESFPVIV